MAYYGRQPDDIDVLGAVTTGGITPGFTPSGGGGFGTAGATGGGVPAGQAPTGGTSSEQKMGGYGPGSRTDIKFVAGQAVARFQAGGVQPRVAAGQSFAARIAGESTPAGAINYPVGGLFSYYGDEEDDDGLAGFWSRIGRAFTPSAGFRRKFTRSIIRPAKRVIRYGGAVVASPFVPAGTLRKGFGLTPRESKGFEIGAKVGRGVLVTAATLGTGAFIAEGGFAGTAAFTPVGGAAGAGAGGGVITAGLGAGGAFVPAYTTVGAFPATIGTGAAAKVGWAAKLGAAVKSGFSIVPLKTLGAAALIGGVRGGAGGAQDMLLEAAGFGGGGEGEPTYMMLPEIQEDAFTGGEVVAPMPRRAPAEKKKGITRNQIIWLGVGGGLLYFVATR